MYNFIIPTRTGAWENSEYILVMKLAPCIFSYLLDRSFGKVPPVLYMKIGRIVSKGPGTAADAWLCLVRIIDRVADF